MQYTVTKQRLDYIGYIWQPGVGMCAQSQDLTAHDLANLGDPTDREAVDDWLGSHSGDFQHIVDFRADFHIGKRHIIHDWARGEESEAAFNDAMYGEEDA